MFGSRWIGILGSSLILLSAVRETIAFYIAFSVNEVGMEVAEVRFQFYLACLGAFIGIIAITRVAILLTNARPYSVQITSWCLLAISLLVYLYLNQPVDHPQPVCDGQGEKICFGIYDMGNRLDLIEVVGVLFVVLSSLRFLVTSFYVGTRPKFR